MDITYRIMKRLLPVGSRENPRPLKHVGACIRRFFPFLSGVVLALPWTASAALSAPNTGDPPSARMMAKAQEFRKQAQTESEAAFVNYVGDSDKARKLFGFLGKTLCPNTDPAKGWVYFFETSIWSLSFPSTTTAVAVYYHPWSDVALVTEWTRKDTGTTLTDADLIMGDALRNLSKPPYEIEPHWLRSPLPSHLAAGISSARTVRGFEKIFSPLNEASKTGWRSAMQLGDSSLMDTNHTSVGTMFERNLAGLTRYHDDAAMAPVRDKTREVLEQIRNGRFDMVYKTATETLPQVRAILKDHANKWGDAKVITCVTKRDDQKKDHTFVVLSMPKLPELYMSFWFRPGTGQSTPAALTRIDMVDQSQSYKYLGSVDRMNQGPERGDMTRETIESGNWFARLITIGESAMQGVERSGSSGPIGSLMGGCCDELIGSTAWDMVAARPNNAVRPAREQVPVPISPSTGGVRSSAPAPPTRIQQGRPQGDGVVARSTTQTSGVEGLPPRSPHVTQPPGIAGSSSMPPRGPQVTQPPQTGRPPGTFGNGSMPPHGPQVIPPATGRPPSGGPVPSGGIPQGTPPLGNGPSSGSCPPNGGSCPAN
jgi:hypothetical protein